ncbi:MAG TPA: GNAT family N-acetyltransferase [Gemmatimonadales bacterium]|nr:GNAT family N-acetyltransferase [Gemmatimonadales bacterium]
MMVDITPFEPADYEEAMALWRATEGLTLRDVDNREAVLSYLAQNPHLCFVARDADVLVGAVLAGTDGRRGYLQHLAVARSHRGQGLGRALAERTIEALRASGIEKCHLMIRHENATARAFWKHLGWTVRDDVVLMSHAAPGAPNA